jgi:hypothetical protein
MPETSQESRHRYDALMDYVSEALHAGQERMDRMESNIADNTRAIEQNTAAQHAHADATREVLEAFNAMKGGFKVLETIGKAGRFIAGIVAGGAAIYGVWQATLKIFKG